MFLHVNDKNDRQVGNDGLIYVGSASVVFHPVRARRIECGPGEVGVSAARAFFNFMLIRSSERFVLPRDSDYP